VQALDYLKLAPHVEARMQAGDCYEKWLEEEEQYLNRLNMTPPEETWKMEYYKRLQLFYEAEAKVASLRQKVNQFDPGTQYATGSRRRSPETAMRHALERTRLLAEEVATWESKYDIEQRWTSDCLEWKEAAELVANARFRTAVDRLEGLIVARMFELTKMNRSQTGMYQF
jgi:hypothetical protein